MLRFARESESFLEKPPLGDALHAAAGSEHTRFVPGDVIARRYRIVGLLGSGGMGDVYRADDLKLGQPVALKFLSETLANDGAALARFHREVSLARQVSHRHVCRVYDIGEHAGMHFLSMEYVRGEELSSLLKRVGRLPHEKAIDVARQLCAGLAAIHAAGVLHRDLKPANVMIDEQGDVRITDFGIAALVEGGARETMLGTPAYMAPEQLERGEVTTRSDIYALGLVLFETFTGKRPPAAITGVDANVEHVILRCLERDPQRRPATALQVIAALPGGNPLAAALAAGETPSPQMVAAAPTPGTLRPLAAVALLVSIFTALALIAIASTPTALHRLVPLDRPAALLRADADDIAREAGYGAAADSASGFMMEFDVVRFIANGDSHRDRWSRLRELPAIQFWVRRSPRLLEPFSVWHVDADDPPNILPGMVRMRLDTRGRLWSFDAVPTTRSTAAKTDWSRFFARAGLSMAAFQPATPQVMPPQPADARFAWTGARGVPLRVEAASWRGTPVFFEVIGPWGKPEPLPATWSASSGDPLAPLLLILYFGAIAIAALLAWKNLRLGRGDRRSAWRLGIVIFICRIVYWLFTTHHVPVLGELSLLVAGLQSAVYWAVLVALLYIALEPFIRRRWPEALIGWSRLLAGDVRDPLVGRDVLVGFAAGLAVILSLHLFYVRRPMPFPAVGSLLRYQYGFDGAAGFPPVLATQLIASILFPLILMTVVTFFAMLTRRRAVGLAVVGLVLYAATALNFGDGTAFAYGVALIAPAILVFALARYGLLALSAAFVSIHVWPFYPVTTDLGAWYATTYVLELAFLVAIALYAFRVALAGQAVLNDAWLDG